MKQLLVALCATVCLNPLAACSDNPSCADVVRHLQSLPRSKHIKVAPPDVWQRNCERQANPEFNKCLMKSKSLEDAKTCELEAAFKQLKKEEAEEKKADPSSP